MHATQRLLSNLSNRYEDLEDDLLYNFLQCYCKRFIVVLPCTSLGTINFCQDSKNKGVD